MPRKKARGPGRPRKTTNAFGRWIDAKGWTRDDVARRLRITRGYLDMLCEGRRRPSLELAMKIEQLSRGGVPATRWLKTPPHSRD
ncbi:helix-turn-helix transcriptional regulator [Myxococcota bacterium]